MLEDSTKNRLTLAAKIRTAIAESGLTKASIAEQVDKSAQAITGWTTTGRIDKFTLAKLAPIVGKPLSYFVGDDADQPTSVAHLEQRVRDLTTIVTALVQAMPAHRPLAETGYVLDLLRLVQGDDSGPLVQEAIEELESGLPATSRASR